MCILGRVQIQNYKYTKPIVTCHSEVMSQIHEMECFSQVTSSKIAANSFYLFLKYMQT